MKLSRKTFLALSAIPAALFATSAQAQDKYFAEIFLIASSFCPEDSLETLGQTLNINQNQALYSLIGNTYGGDIRQMNFMLPKMAPPLPKMRYCIVTQGLYPPRPD